MSDALSPKSQAFLRSVQDADDPTRDDYDRVRAGVKARLAASVAAGVAALVTAKTVAASEAAVLTAVTATTATAVTAVTTASVGSGAAVPTGSAGVAFATKLVAVVLVVGAAAGGTTAVVRHQQAMHASAAEATTVHATANVPRDLQAPQARPPMPLPPTLATALATIEPTSPPALTPPPAPSPAPSPAIATALTTETASAPSSLDAEIALVRDARAALRGGDAARALALLDEHARRFSRGALAEDCDAERIYALCALGRSSDARSLASRFLTSHPASPHGASVRASCGGGTN